MATPDPELEALLDEPPADRPPPILVPWGWRIYFVLLVGFDLVCLLVGRVPWTGGAHGLDRADALLIIVVGLLLGALTALIAESFAASHAAQIGLTDDEARLVADELSILTRPSRVGRAGIVPMIALVWVVCTLLARFVFPEATLPATTVFTALHTLAGLALPVLWRSYQAAGAEFLAWLDEKNAPFDAAAAARAAAHRARVAALIARIRQAEDQTRERLSGMARVAPPVYLVPQAMWAPLVLALLLDIVLLASPDARHAALAAKQSGAGVLLWRTLGLWVGSLILVGIIYSLLAWYYTQIGDQVGRQWSARDWSGGAGAVAIELLYGGLAVALLLSLVLGWHARFVVWNLLAATPLLAGVLRDIRDIAAQHYHDSVNERAGKAGPPPT